MGLRNWYGEGRTPEEAQEDAYRRLPTGWSVHQEWSSYEAGAYKHYIRAAPPAGVGVGYMTDENYARYRLCPVCGCSDLESGEWWADDALVWRYYRDVACFNCRSEWVEYWSLVGYAELIDRSEEVEDGHVS